MELRYDWEWHLGLFELPPSVRVPQSEYHQLLGGTQLFPSKRTLLGEDFAACESCLGGSGPLLLGQGRLLS